MSGDIHDRFFASSAFRQFGDERMAGIVQPPLDGSARTNVCPSCLQSRDGARWIKLVQLSEGEEIPLWFDSSEHQREPLTVFHQGIVKRRIEGTRTTICFLS